MNRIRYAEISYFLLYAFTIPLVCIGFMKYVPGCRDGVLNLLLYGMEGASPALAAIIVVMRSGGINSIKKFLKEKYEKGLSLRYCVIGFILPAALLTIAKWITYMFHSNDNQYITMPSAKKFLIILWALIAEELGWRGYLQNKVEKRFGDTLTPVIIGIIWAIWHYHFWISGTMDVPILLFTYGCIAESYGYYVITKLSKGNVIPASLWHFSGNLFFNLYLINPTWNHGSIISYLIVNVLYSINIGAFVWYKRKSVTQLDLPK